MIRLTTELNDIIVAAKDNAEKSKAEFLLPEHVFMELSENSKFERIFKEVGGDIDIFRAEIKEILDEVDTSSSLEVSPTLAELLNFAVLDAKGRGIAETDVASFLNASIHYKDSNMLDLLDSQGVDDEEFMLRYLDESPSADDGDYDESWHELVKDFNKIAAAKKEPLIGREKEIDDTIRILCRKEKSNPLHVGEPGVGKTAITLGLAKRINEGKVPAKLKDKKIYEVEMSSLLAGARYKGDFEERLKTVLDGAAHEKNAILYIDEIHTVIGAGKGSEDAMDAGNMIKKALVEGKISFIGATTYDEYRKYIQKDKAFERRFKVVDVVEPTIDETVEILKGLRPYYEDFHHVTYSDKVLEKAVNLSVKYMADRFLPDKAIDIIDEAGATISKDLLIKPATKTIVSENLIEEIISRTCKIPTTTVSTSETKKILGMADDIKKVVFGQDEAIETVTKAIKKSRAGLVKRERPIANLLFVGPTGVGKTEIAKQIAKSMNVELVRFDMSEYKNETSVNKLIGSDAGYVGYDDGGRLVEAIRKNPHCVLLLDEIEKAHQSIFDVLLQIMDYATLTDNKGRKADFKNVVLIMTSNAGARNATHRQMGIGQDLVVYDNTAIEKAVKSTFSPEFVARLTKIVEFNPLSEEMGKEIVTYQLQKLVDELASKKISLTYTDEVVKYVEEKGITKESGARQILNIIENDLEDVFVDGLLDGSLEKVGKITLDVKDGKPILV